MPDFTEIEKKVISALQKDMPTVKRPYKILAENTGIDEDTFIKTVENLAKRKIIRRLGATLKHQESGFSANAMCAWIVDEKKADKVGKQMASFPEVTHCYMRGPQKDWKYNFYTMIHAKDRETCKKIAKKISTAASVEEYELLFSEEELKKTSMQYF